MKKILIIPYFGSFPNYFQIFLNSCSYNNRFDFLIITDQSYTDYKYRENIKFINMTFLELQQLIKKELSINIDIQSPYKLCDYRPAYGKIFNKYIKKYDFWGYCDIDLIFGNLSKFLSEEIFKSNDKIQTNGHLTFYRNNDLINNLYLNESEKCINFIDAIKIKEPCFFDEIQFNTIVKESGIKQYTNYKYADILPNNFEFIIAKNNENVNYKNQIFTFNHGHVIRKYKINNKDYEDEFMYIHLQKRKMKIYIDKDEDEYFINPNNFSKKNLPDKINKKTYKIMYYFNLLKKINFNRIVIKLNVYKQKRSIYGKK